jgi:hypothetical protein
MNKPIEVNEYGVVGVLIASGLSPSESKIQNGRVVFVFPNERGQASKALQDHITGKLVLPTREVVSSILAVKSEIFAARRGESR